MTNGSTIMRGSSNFRQGDPGQSDKKSSSAYFTEVKWLLLIPYRNPYNLWFSRGGGSGPPSPLLIRTWLNKGRKYCSILQHFWPSLTHLSRMNFPISISRTSLFQILGVLGGIFHFYSNLNRTFCKQTVVVSNQMPCSAASDLGLHCLPMSH